MEQDRHIQRAAIDHLVDDLRRQRVIALHFAAFDLRHQADRADGMLIDRVVVVHVELHLRVDPAKIGYKAPEHPSFIQPAQHRFGIVAAGQQFEEQGVGARIVTQFIDQPGIAQREPHGIGVQFQPLGIGHHEHLKQPRWVLRKPGVRRDRELAAEHAVAFDRAFARAKPRQQPARLALGKLLVELGEEQPGQMADAFGLQEKVLHESFDRALARAVGKLHPRGNFALHIEGQPVFGAPGDRVQMAPHRPEKVLGTAERAVFSRGQQPGADQFGHIADVVDIFADPVERVQIAQAALALFHIGFDHIAAVAQSAVTVIPLGQFFGHVLPLGPGHHFTPEPRAGLIKQRLITPDIAPFKQRSADRQVTFRHPHDIIERAARLADLERQIPQVIEDRFDHLLAPGGLLARGDEGDIDIRMRGHFAAAIAAHRHDRQPLTRSSIVRRVKVGDDVIVDHAD